MGLTCFPLGHLWDKVAEGDSYQYCIRCGKARAIPKRQCDHTFKIIKTVENYQYESDKLPSSFSYHLQCTKCGDIKHHRLAPGSKA